MKITICALAIVLILACCATPTPDSAQGESGWAFNAAGALGELEARDLTGAAGYREALDKKLTCEQASELICLVFDLTDRDYLDYVLRETGDDAPAGGYISRERFMWWVFELGETGGVGETYAGELVGKFTDHEKIGDTYYTGVAQLAANHIVFGDGSTRLIPERAVTAGEAVSILARAVKAGRLHYDNPRDVVITQPMDIYRETTQSHMSILGVCDYDYPLYMNGVEIPATPRGFFMRYVELKDGDNIFSFKNNGKEETITITKKTPVETHGTPNPVQAVMYDAPVYAVAVSEHISHMRSPGSDTDLLTSLAKDTVMEIKGEIGSAYGLCYITKSGTYVYQSSVELLDKKPPENNVTGARITHDDRYTRVIFDMDVNAFYNLDRTANWVRLTVDAASDESSLDPAGTPIVDIVKTAGDKTVTYYFAFQEAPTGHLVEFEDGKMIVEFKHAVKSLDEARVILDAGHGGEDTGALGPPKLNGPAEKDFNLYVAYAAKAYLESRGITVMLTREDDTRVTLTERVSETLSYKPDVFVSIHSNSAPVTEDYGKKRGPLMFYSYDTALKAADHIYKSVTGYFGLDHTNPIEDNFAVTRVAICPTMLFEMGYVCNIDDYEWLLLKDNLNDMGEALGKGIEGYLTGEAENS